MCTDVYNCIHTYIVYYNFHNCACISYLEHKFAADSLITMKTYSIIILVYHTVLLASGTEFLSKRINESLIIQCPCKNTSICDWNLYPIQWVQANGDLLLPANDWSVYGVVGGNCGSVGFAYEITNPGMRIST